MADTDTQVSLLDISDEDFMKVDETTLLNTTVSTDLGNVEDTSVVTTTDKSNEDQPQGNKEPETGSTTEVDDESNKVQDTSKDENKEPKQEAKATEVTKPEVKQDSTEPKQNEAVTPETQLAALFAPFKANGREMQVNTIEEARTLMQKGAGFNKRMEELKPDRKLVQMLKNNDLNDEVKLGYLIDLANKKPEAISKLIQESGHDALDLGADKAEKYTPSQHSVTDTEIGLEDVLNDLRGSPAIAKTLDIVTKQWDKKSRDIIAENPEVLRAINDQVDNGIFDLVSTEVERKKALGELAGLSKFEAYHQVGDAMNADGKFAHIGAKATNSQQTTLVAPVVVQPKVKQADDDEQRAAKRKAASGTPPKAVTQVKPATTKSLLDMSPEEFEKFNPFN